MAEIAVTVTDLQLKALRRLDPVLTAKQVVQLHVDTWLAPILVEMAELDRKALVSAYVAASPSVQTQVKGLLSLG